MMDLMPTSALIVLAQCILLIVATYKLDSHRIPRTSMTILDFFRRRLKKNKIIPSSSPWSDEELYQRGLIITDNKAHLPILDFDAYKDALVKIISGSYPNFTVGIYGEWGTGKTTLMSVMKEALKQNNENIVTVWFDSWRYANEKEFALIPLLKTINYAIDEREQDKKKLKEALKEAAIFTLGVSRDIVSSTVTNYIGQNLGGLFKRSLEDVTTRLIPKLRQLSEIDKNAIFFQGIDRIQNEINKLRSHNKDFRIVVFVDDLDRCSEQKVLEVLESIKVFLALDGFIYVLGVSHDKVAELITRKYGTDGEQYLKKFIQIPVRLPEWDRSDIRRLVKEFLKRKIISENYKSIVEDNIEDITKVLEENPRQTKRFLNNLIISYEVFVKIQDLKDDDKKKLFLKQLFLVQVINSSWRDLYRLIIISNGNILEKLASLTPLNIDKITAVVGSKSKTEIDPRVKEILDKYKSNSKLWDFLSKDNLNILRQVSDWDIFRRATKVTEEKLSSKPITDKALKGKEMVTGEIAVKESFLAEQSIQCDVCIIGSGAAGCVLAYELSRNGKSVIILEKGGHYPIKWIKEMENNQEELVKLWKNGGNFHSRNSSINIEQGQCVGGSTIMSYGIYFEIPDAVFTNWQQNHKVAISKDELAAAYKRVKNMTNVTKIDVSNPGKSHLKLKEGCKKLGYSGDWMSRSYIPGEGTQNAYVAYLKKADFGNIQLYPNCVSEEILISDRKVDGVTAYFGNNQTKESQKLTVHANHVIVSAGSIASSELLHRNHLLTHNGHVGKHLSLHPSSYVVAEFDEEIQGDEGYPMAYYCDQFSIRKNPEPGFMIESLGVPSLEYSIAMPSFGEQIRKNVKNYGHAAVAEVLVHDEPNGTVTLDWQKNAFIDYQFSKVDQFKMIEGLKQAARIYLEAGAKQVITAHTQKTEIKKEEDLKLIDRRSVNLDSLLMRSTHPQGGNRRGEDLEYTVVNSKCQHHQVENLFVCDASVFPTSLGVNPQFTVMAIATLTSDYINSM